VILKPALAVYLYRSQKERPEIAAPIGYSPIPLAALRKAFTTSSALGLTMACHFPHNFVQVETMIVIILILSPAASRREQCASLISIK
jgi:hypothetical protein